MVFSCGRSGRDYDFLVDALSGSEYNVVIACDIFRKENLPDNVTVLDHCFGEDTNRMLNECYCVVIPLRNKNISNGQLMILKAMSIGKPIIATNTNGVIDYIQDGVNGFLIDNNRKELLEKLNILQNPDEYGRISKNCMEIFNGNFSSKVMYRRISGILNV